MSAATFLADFETEIWSLQDLKPHPDNPRKHPKRDSSKWKALMESLKHDYFDPIVVNRLNGLLVSGHFRRELLLELGEVQARVVVKEYDDVTHKARMIAANTLVGEWEDTMLATLAGELEGAGVDIALMCLTQKEWNALLDAPETTDDSEYVEELKTKAELLQEKHRVQPGDLFQIGPHTWRGGFNQSTVIDDQIDLRKLTKPELISLCGHLLNGTDTSVIREPRNVCSDLHPTVKPLRLVARQLYNSSRNGDTVLELFGGSGTTMAAAQQIGLRCVATELDPKFCAVELERMIGYGLQPERINGLV